MCSRRRATRGRDVGLRIAILGLVLLALMASAGPAAAGDPPGPRAVGERAADWAEGSFQRAAARAQEEAMQALGPAGGTPGDLQAQAGEAWSLAWFLAYDAADLALVLADMERDALDEGLVRLKACPGATDPARCLDEWLDWALSA